MNFSLILSKIKNVKRGNQSPEPEKAENNPNENQQVVFICEGGKDVEILAKHDLIGIRYPIGTGKWRDDYSESLAGLDCVVLPKNDGPGRKHAEFVASSIIGKASSVKILLLPELQHKGSVSDWFEKGHSAEELLALIESTGLFEVKERIELKLEKSEKSATNKIVEKKVEKQEEPKKPKKQSNILQKILENLSLFHTANDECFAVLEFDSHNENINISSKEFRSWLSRHYFVIEKKTPSTYVLTDVIENLRGRALFDSPQMETHIRVAESDGEIYIDIGNKEWQAIKVTKDDWKIVESTDVPVRFCRPRGMLALPIPERGGTIDELSGFVNVLKTQMILLFAWLVNCFRPNRPFPILALHGEHGSAKTTTSEVLRALIDPNKSPLRSNPKTERDLATAQKTLGLSLWIIYQKWRPDFPTRFVVWRPAAV